MGKIYKCHKISGGVVEAEVAISKDDVMFYLIEPDTGIMVEEAHDYQGRNLSRKILIFPSGKGSSVVQADGIFQLQKYDNGPAGFIVEYPETVLVSSAVLFEIPMVDKVDPEFYEDIKDGDTIRLDADNEIIQII